MTVEDILAALKAIVDEAANDGDRNLTEEEVERYEELEGKLQAARTTKEIQKRNAIYAAPVRTDLHVHAGGQEVTAELRAFQNYCLTGDGAEYRALTKGTTTAGGYLLPTTTQAKIVERLKAFGGLANEAEVITTSDGNPINWATEDDWSTAPVSGTVPAEIVAEGGAAATAGYDKVFGQTTLGAYKYEATGASNLPMKVSWELLQDSPINLEDHIANNFARRIARKFSVDICTGNGTTEPQGIVTPQTAFDEIASNTAGPTYAELLGAVAALDPEYRVGAKWLMSDASWFALMGLVDDIGRPLLQDNGTSGLANGAQFSLLGYPVVVDQGMPAIGDQSKSIVFGDLFESYIVRNVDGFQLVRLNELYAVNGFVGFLGWARRDGRVKNLNSYVVLAGQNV